MLKKVILALVLGTAAFATANAQTNLQMFYDLGRGYATTTLEGFYADSWGDTFFFIDHYYATKADRSATGAGSAINGSYFEIERNLNFWKNTKLADLSLHVEYDGATWGAGVACIGLNYFMHSKDFKNIYNVAVMYDHHIGYGSASVPVKFTGVWGMQDLFGVKGLRFSGFIDIWGLDSSFAEGNTKFTILSEPQLWYCVGQHIGVPNLNLGGEVELSYNFAGNYGFKCLPCIGAKWVF